MRRILVCSGVLGGGTALVFGAAALTAMAFPAGTTLSAGWSGPIPVENAWGGPAMRMPPQVAGPDVVGPGEAVPPDGFQPLPGDIVVEGPAPTGGVVPAP